MSAEARIYGFIAGAHGTPANWYGLYSLNHAVVESLPVEDEFPPLSRGVFTVPMDFGRHGTAFFREQMIHFGASFNHMSEYWHLWLEKFEGLLRRLYWWEARVHLEMEMYGSYQYHWRSVWSGTDMPWYRNPPEPVEEWKFEGGPRDFRESESSDVSAGEG